MKQLQEQEAQKIAQIEAEKQQIQREKREIIVDAEDVLNVVSLATGIPAGNLLTSEIHKVVGLAEKLKQRIYGQDEAVDQLCDALFSSLIQSQGRMDRPKAAFFIVGPSGVGKTALCKQLAEELFGEQQQQHALVTLDMSQMSERHSLSRLVGAPPGYVGYGQGGLLTDPVKRTPHSILLLENINYAHSDVIDLVSTLLERGEIIDATGKTVNFMHTMVLLTTTLSEERSKQILSQGRQQQGFSDTRQDKDEGSGAVGASLDSTPQPRPPSLPQKLVERVDNVLVLRSLSSLAYQLIASHHINNIIGSFEHQGVHLVVGESVLDSLLQGWGRMSAHGIEKLVRQKVSVPIGKALVNSGYAAVLTQSDGSVQVKVKMKSEEDVEISLL